MGEERRRVEKRARPALCTRLLPMSPVPLSQEAKQQRPDWELALSAREARRSGFAVSQCSLGSLPPSRGRIGGGVDGGRGNTRSTCAFAFFSPLDPATAPLSQEPWRQRPERQLALATLEAHRADTLVSHCSSAPPPPSHGIGSGGTRRVTTPRGSTHVALATLVPAPHDTATTPLAQEPLPQQSGRRRTLAAWATYRADTPVSHCSTAPPCLFKPWQDTGREGMEGGDAQGKHARRTCVCPCSPCPRSGTPLAGSFTTTT